MATLVFFSEGISPTFVNSLNHRGYTSDAHVAPFP